MRSRREFIASIAIERKQFGHDGFDDAVRQISAIESQLCLSNLAQFTAPPPPKVKTL